MGGLRSSGTDGRGATVPSSPQQMGGGWKQRVTGRKTHDPVPCHFSCLKPAAHLRRQPPILRLSAASSARRERDWSHRFERRRGRGFSYNPVAMTASGFTRESGGDPLETRPPAHHMQSVRGSLSGPRLGSGWSLLPHPHRPHGRSGTGDGSTLRSAGAPRIMVRGSDGGSRSSFCFGGGTPTTTAETRGTGRLVLDGWERGAATGVGGSIELAQSRAEMPRCNAISAATRPDTRERLRRGPVEKGRLSHPRGA